MTRLILIYLFLFINCKEETSIVQKESTEKKQYYIDSLNGTDLYEEPNKKNKIILTIPHGKEIQIRPELLKLEEEGIEVKWRRIIFSGVSGWVKDQYISDKIEKYYYVVIPKQGLNIRENPDLDSKILNVIPNGYIGEFVNRTWDSEDDNKIFWIETEYNLTKGWIHSGFTLISKNPNILEEKVGYGEETWFYRLYNDSEKTFLEEIQISKEEILQKKILKRLELAPYTIFEIENNIAEDDCYGPKSQVLFYNNSNHKVFSRKGVFKETILSSNQPFDKTIYTVSQLCNCCCEIEDSTLYFIYPDKIIPFDYKFGNQKAACISDGESNRVELSKEYRFQKDTDTLFAYLRLPICKMDELEPNSIGLNRKVKGYKTDLFLVLKRKSETIQVEKFYNEKIPKKFIKEWENLKTKTSLPDKQ
jgi:hypothetical protein